MGNGAGVEANLKGNPNKRYEKLEKICRGDYFHQEHALYVKALEEAISHDSLDCLELLLVSGNTRKAQPLHLACAAAKLESVELMLSAGFSGETVNKEKRTPLHMCCLTVNPEAGLCASLLGLRFPKSIKHYDYMGQTPIHFAASMDNVFVMKALIQIDQTLVKLPDQSGKTPLHIAKSKNSAQCKDFLEFSAKNASTQKQTQSSPQVDQDRIMEVWERFFENAFKMAGGMMGDDDEDEDDHYHNICSTGSSQNNYFNHGKSAVVSTKTASYQVIPPQPIYHDNYITAIDDSNDYYEDDWFYWIVCYDQAYAQDYFVVNSWNLERKWLTEFMSSIFETRSYRFVYSDYVTVANQPYPQSLQEARDWGWLTYYSEIDNYCQWMNVVTTVFEMFLPVGVHDSPTRLQNMNLIPSEDDGEWYEADQSCSFAWIMVVAQDEHNYYINTMTNHTSWEPPLGWDELVCSWNYWILCCMEEDISLKFWYDSHSGESRWLEE